MFRNFTGILEKTRKRLSSCRYIRLVNPEKGETAVFDYDRSKLVFSTKYASITGSELYHMLLEKYELYRERVEAAAQDIYKDVFQDGELF